MLERSCKSGDLQWKRRRGGERGEGEGERGKGKDVGQPGPAITLLLLHFHVPLYPCLPFTTPPTGHKESGSTTPGWPLHGAGQGAGRSWGGAGRGNGFQNDYDTSTTYLLVIIVYCYGLW